MPIASEILARLMSQAGLTNNELADKTGIPQPTISRILRNESRDPRDSTLRPLAKYFGITVSQLRGDVPLPSSQVRISANDDVQEVSVDTLRLAMAIESMPQEKRGALQTLVEAIAYSKNLSPSRMNAG